MNPLAQISLVFGAAAMALITVVIIWRRRDVPGRTAFIGLMLSLCAWSYLDGLYTLADDTASKVFIAQCLYLPIAGMPLLWLLTTRSIAGRPPLRLRVVAAMAIMPLFTVLLAWTNDRHGLIWDAIIPAGRGLIFTHGLWFWIFTTYSYALLAASLVILTLALRQTTPAFRPQIQITLLAGLLPWLGNILYLSRVIPIPDLDPTPLTFTISGLLMLWGLTRHRLFSLVPIARSVLIDHMGDGVIVLDHQRRIIDFNPAALRLSGLRPDALGEVLSAALPALAPTLVADLSIGEPYLIEPLGPRAASIEVEITPLAGTRRQTSGWLIVLHDVSLRQRLSAQLRAERDFALQVMHTMGEGLTVTDAQGRFIFVNDAYGRMLGYTPAELIGRTPYDLTAAEDAETLRQQHLARSQGQISSYLNDLRAADGRLVHVQITGTPRFIDGQFVGSIAVITDLTERIVLDRRLQETQHLESIGTLAGGVAHDFNNLLMAMLGNAELTLMDLPAGSPAAASVQAIIDGAKQAAELTGRLLAYAGRGRFQRGPVDLNRLLDDLDPLIRAALRANSQLGYDLAPNLPQLAADARQLRQAVLNLLVNADEALGAAGGQIVIATAVADLDAAALGGMLLGKDLSAGRYVQLSVSDTGIGMDAATQARIFEPFFSTRFAGRGLGLASVYGIVRSHCGAIQVSSAPGMGATIRIWLPVAGTPPH